MSLSATRPYSMPLPHIVARYETLRRAALGEALPPEARTGLAVLLYRGMWGWARTLLVSGVQRQQFLPTTYSFLTEPSERSTVIHLFTALAMPTP
jgi:hypothetical protein